MKAYVLIEIESDNEELLKSAVRLARVPVQEAVGIQGPVHLATSVWYDNPQRTTLWLGVDAFPALEKIAGEIRAAVASYKERHGS